MTVYIVNHLFKEYYLYLFQYKSFVNFDIIKNFNSISYIIKRVYIYILFVNSF